MDNWPPNKFSQKQIRLLKENSDNEQNQNDDAELVEKPGIGEERKAVQILEDVSFFSQFGEAMLKVLKDVNCSIDKDELCDKIQTSEFFLKK